MRNKIYDNSNIAESYAGSTTPLTFSFVRHVYQEVYTYFCEMMGVSNKVIGENEQMFEHMVEFIGYRIYYNLGNWYRMLSFFPGYKFSSGFMEKMMGVGKEYHITETLNYNFSQFPKTLLQVFKISISFLLLGIRIKRFNRYFDRIFSKVNSTELGQLSLKELKNLYAELDDKLLSRWRVPIANDFAVMVSAGLADKLFKEWLNSDNAYSHMISTTNKPLTALDPGNRILQIANAIKKEKDVHELFSGDYKEEDILKLLYGRFSTYRASREIDAYLKQFGARIPNELKLESETLTENPKNFIKLVKNIVQNGTISQFKKTTRFKQGQLKNLSVIRKVFLRWLLQWAGNSIQRREETRFRRALIFGYARKIFLAIGKKLQQKQFINNPRDIFYLTVEEVFKFTVSDQKIDYGLLTLVRQRKKQFKTWENVELPRRIETQKSLTEFEDEFLAESTIQKGLPSMQSLKGRVASQPNNTKIFSGVVLTLKDFDPTANFRDKILVTRQTDPGWTIIFPFLKGLVVERGGMLSHAAIVARELNIPCIVGVENATDLIANGTNIKLDLQNGEIYTS